MENRQKILHRIPIEDIEQCYGKPEVPCEADEETCPCFHSCTQIAIDSVMEKLREIIRIEIA